MQNQTTAVVTSTAAPADTDAWAIDANRLRCLDQQETNLTKGDEVYVASILFRTTPGVMGSTRTAFHGHLIDMPDIRTGDAPFIPNSMGRVLFPGVTRVGLADIDDGRNPEVVGTATVVMESDLSKDTKIDNLFTEAAADARPIIAGVAETLDFEDLADGETLGAVMGQLVKDLRAAIEPTVFEKIGLAVLSGFDPDDKIADRLNVFVAVDDVLAPFVDAAVAEALPAGVGVGGALRPRSYSQRFAGKGAVYVVDFSVSRT